METLVLLQASATYTHTQFLRGFSFHYQDKEFTVKQRNVNEAQECKQSQGLPASLALRGSTLNPSESVQGFKGRSRLIANSSKKQNSHTNVTYQVAIRCFQQRKQAQQILQPAVTNEVYLVMSLIDPLYFALLSTCHLCGLRGFRLSSSDSSKCLGVSCI